MQELTVFRYVVFAVFAAGALVSLAAWAVRTRQVNPFGPMGRVMRAFSEPFVRPMERWLVKSGRNPQSAAWWIFGITLVGGILAITVVTWVVGQVWIVRSSATSGRGVLRLVVLYAGRLIMFALIVRVIASWFGQFRFSKWIRWAYWLTDWMVEPLRKIIPPVGMIDITPLIAWFLFQLLMSWVMRLL